MSTNVKKRIEIKTLLKQGFTTSHIARILRVNPKTVWKWSHRKGHADKKRSGRPRKCSPRSKQVIRRQMKEKLGASIRKTTRILNMSESYKIRRKQISRESIRRHLKTTKWGKKNFATTKRTLLSQKNVADRMKLGEMVEKSGIFGSERVAQETIDHAP